VTDAQSRKGLFKSRAVLYSPTPGLGLSDVVLSCGSVTTTLDPANPRVEIDPKRRVRGTEPLVAYFEIYGLAPESNGLSRFEYQVRVFPTEDQRRWWVRAFTGADPPSVVEVHREETHVGSLRRQFVTVPVRDLTPGRYRLAIDVRDRVSGQTVTSTSEFLAD